MIEALPNTSAFASALDELKSKVKIDVRKEVFAHLGPKIAIYTLPGSTSARADEDAAEKSAPGAARRGPGSECGPGGTLAGLMGKTSVPKFAIVAEIDDPERFGKTMDGVIIGVNKILRERAAAAAAAAEAETAANSNDPGGAPPGRPGMARGGPGGPARKCPPRAAAKPRVQAISGS